LKKSEDKKAPAADRPVMDRGSALPKLLDTEAEAVERWSDDGITPLAEDDEVEQRQRREFVDLRTGKHVWRVNGGKHFKRYHPPANYVPKFTPKVLGPLTVVYEEHLLPEPLASFRDLRAAVRKAKARGWPVHREHLFNRRMPRDAYAVQEFLARWDNPRCRKFDFEDYPTLVEYSLCFALEVEQAKPDWRRGDPRPELAEPPPPPPESAAMVVRLEYEDALKKAEAEKARARTSEYIDETHGAYGAHVFIDVHGRMWFGRNRDQPLLRGKSGDAPTGHRTYSDARLVRDTLADLPRKRKFRSPRKPVVVEKKRRRGRPATIGKDRPWETEGISRRTFERRNPL
jgi:hypothetical protein